MTDSLSRSNHFDDQGAARMVDVGEKSITSRVATAQGFVRMQASTLQTIASGQSRKGDVLQIARIAGIQGAKQTSQWIPLCHPLPLDAVEVGFQMIEPDRLQIQASVKVTARTGVEMEALTAVSAAALTVYDMCKSIDRSMTIESIELLSKSGGRSGDYRKEETS